MYIHLDLYRAFISRCARHILLFRRLPCIFCSLVDMHGMYSHISPFRALFIRRGVRYLRRHVPLCCVRLQLRLHFVVFLCIANCAVDIHLLRMSTSYNRPAFPT